jgi:hypothetical protein
MPSKNMTRESLKKTTGSMDGLPRAEYASLTQSRTKPRSSLASRYR